jgi:hypothetical protein
LLKKNYGSLFSLGSITCPGSLGMISALRHPFEI